MKTGIYKKWTVTLTPEEGDNWPDIQWSETYTFRPEWIVISLAQGEDHEEPRLILAEARGHRVLKSGKLSTQPKTDCWHTYGATGRFNRELPHAIPDWIAALAYEALASVVRHALEPEALDVIAALLRGEGVPVTEEDEEGPDELIRQIADVTGQTGRATEPYEPGEKLAPYSCLVCGHIAQPEYWHKSASHTGAQHAGIYQP